MNRSIFTLALPAIVLLLWSASSINAFQEPDGDGHNIQRVETVSGFRRGQNLTYNDQGLARFGTVNGRRSNKDPMREAVNALQNAENDDQRDEAEDSIREMLEEQYDSFLEANEKQIVELQDRLDSLKDQLERRRRAKSKMVDLEIQRVVNEAEGLIWPNQNNRRTNLSFRNSVFAPPAAINLPARSPFPAQPPEPTIAPEIRSPTQNQRTKSNKRGGR